jgi:hypothetical protein
MKRFVALALTGLLLVAALVLVPAKAAARDVNECYKNHEACRAQALEMNASWVKIALVLTVCDLALGKCILAA